MEMFFGVMLNKHCGLTIVNHTDTLHEYCKSQTRDK